MLLDTLQQDVISSMKAGDKEKTETLRFLISAVKRFQIDSYPPGSSEKLTDSDVLKIIQKQVKTHEESIVAFEKGNRPDLVQKEKIELEILKKYAPQELSEVEIKSLVSEVIAGGATQFGPVMGMVMKKVAGRASGNRVQEIVKNTLQ